MKKVKPKWRTTLTSKIYEGCKQFSYHFSTKFRFFLKDQVNSNSKFGHSPCSFVLTMETKAISTERQFPPSLASLFGREFSLQIYMEFNENDRNWNVIIVSGMYFNCRQMYTSVCAQRVTSAALLQLCLFQNSMLCFWVLYSTRATLRQNN